MIVKKALPALMLMACCGVTGCGTILMRDYPSCRTSQPDQFSLYPATHYDGIIITEGGGIYSYGDCDNGLGPVVGWLVVVPIHVIDLPISLVTDTVLFPADLVRDLKNKKASNQASDATSEPAPDAASSVHQR